MADQPPTPPTPAPSNDQVTILGHTASLSSWAIDFIGIVVVLVYLGGLVGSAFGHGWTVPDWVLGGGVTGLLRGILGRLSP